MTAKRCELSAGRTCITAGRCCRQAGSLAPRSPRCLEYLLRRRSAPRGNCAGLLCDLQMASDPARTLLPFKLIAQGVGRCPGRLRGRHPCSRRWNDLNNCPFAVLSMPCWRPGSLIAAGWGCAGVMIAIPILPRMLAPWPLMGPQYRRR